MKKKEKEFFFQLMQWQRRNTAAFAQHKWQSCFNTSMMSSLTNVWKQSQHVVNSTLESPCVSFSIGSPSGLNFSTMVRIIPRRERSTKREKNGCVSGLNKQPICASHHQLLQNAVQLVRRWLFSFEWNHEKNHRLQTKSCRESTAQRAAHLTHQREHCQHRFFALFHLVWWPPTCDSCTCRRFSAPAPPRCTRASWSTAETAVRSNRFRETPPPPRRCSGRCAWQSARQPNQPTPACAAVPVAGRWDRWETWWPRDTSTGSLPPRRTPTARLRRKQRISMVANRNARVENLLNTAATHPSRHGSQTSHARRFFRLCKPKKKFRKSSHKNSGFLGT